MTLLIEIQPTYPAERQYVLSVLFNEFLGLDINIKRTERNNVRITADNQRELILTDVFFAIPEDLWLKPQSLPKQPLEIWEVPQVLPEVTLVSPQLPVIYGMRLQKGDFVQISDERIDIGLDIFGSAFFMLTRYEEAVKTDRDEFDRFPAKASLAYQEGFLDRPIINEYIEILWWMLKKLWPGLERKKREFRVVLSHDVDRPFLYAFQSPGQLMRNMAGDVIKRKDPVSALQRIRGWVEVKRGNDGADPNNTFNWIMDVSEKSNLKSAFYFMAGRTERYGADYSLDNKRVMTLMKNIHQRGHAIGLHPSFDSYQNTITIKKELDNLMTACKLSGIMQDIWGARQHYLRWDARQTWRNLDNAGLDYDTTLSFADHVGFRCGVCYEYPAFDLMNSKPLDIIECPLIAMESSMLNDKYMGFDEEESKRQIRILKNRCSLFNGAFTLLWHNSNLTSPSERDIYLTAFERR